MAHVRMSKMWDGVIIDFERNNPDLIDEVVDWYPIGQMRIVVVLEDDRRLVYELVGNRTYPFYEPESVDTDDEPVWRNEFSKRLCKKIEYTGITQDRLADESGISRMTISKYVNGKATPSLYNTKRLCKALKCHISELMC